MKTTVRSALAVLFGLSLIASTEAALNIPSDGSDGVLEVAADTVIDLGRAATGAWDANNASNAGKGIYDANQWAVVFKYSRVVVQAGATLTFKNHASRAPVVWLVKGDVIIDGRVVLDGAEGATPPRLAEPGPGGGRGGMGYYARGATASAGLGVGGGGGFGYTAFSGPANGAGGGYATVGGTPSGVAAAPAYGNPGLLPLVGGSGGAGNSSPGSFPPGQTPRGGGAGGGAILVVASGNISLSGRLQANGGRGFQAGNDSVGYNGYSGGGSGGAIRLVCESLQGSGIIEALGGTSGNPGGVGRIRIERGQASGTLQVVPDPSVVPLALGSRPNIWPAANGPTLKVVSVGGLDAPADPRAEFAAAGADLTFPTTPTLAVVLETTHVELASSVFVRVTPRSSGTFVETNAVPILPPVTEDPLVIRWRANVPVNGGYAAVQARVVRP